nr:unnamed protein product [Callosobruchus chinensis]
MFEDSGSSYHPSDSENCRTKNSNKKHKRCLIESVERSDNCLGYDEKMHSDNAAENSQANKTNEQKKGNQTQVNGEETEQKLLEKPAKNMKERKRRAGIEDPDIVKVRAGAIAECLGPALTDDRYFTQEEAISRVRAVGTWIRTNINNIADFTNASETNYVETLAVARDPSNNMGFTEGQIPEAFPAIPPGDADVTLHEAILLITHVANHAAEWVTNYALSSLLHLHVAIAKQGNVTTRFVTKIRQPVQMTA